MGLLGELAAGFILGYVEAKEELKLKIDINLIVCQIYVSIIKYSMLADGIVTKKEESSLDELYNILYSNDGSFLDWNGINDAEMSTIKSKVNITWENPLSISEIKQITRGDTSRKVDLLHFACYATVIDGKFNSLEHKFLKNLAKELNVSAFDRDQIFSKYNIN